MDKKKRYMLVTIGFICLIIWSTVEIYSRIQPKQSVLVGEYHWDIIIWEVILISECYALLLFTGIKRMKRYLQGSR